MYRRVLPLLLTAVLLLSGCGWPAFTKPIEDVTEYFADSDRWAVHRMPLPST